MAIGDGTLKFGGRMGRDYVASRVGRSVIQGRGVHHASGRQSDQGAPGVIRSADCREVVIIPKVSWFTKTEIQTDTAAAEDSLRVR